MSRQDKNSSIVWPVLRDLRSFASNFPAETFLIGMGLSLLLYGYGLTEQENALIDAAGEPEYPPVCSVNPSLHYEESGFWVTECHGRNAHAESEERPNISAAYVLSLEGDIHEQNYLSRKRYLARHGIDLHRFPAANGRELWGHEYEETTVTTAHGDKKESKTILAWKQKDGSTLLPGKNGYLTPGERGYLKSMHSLLQSAYNDRAREHILVLDDDAIFTCSFGHDLSKLLSERRCLNENSVLLLGASIWINGVYPRRNVYTGGWRLFDEDRRLHAEHTGHLSSCANTNSRTFGTFAVIYSRATIPHILKWIEESSKPFDHMFKSIGKKGIHVRVAYPFLAIQDVRHASQIDQTRTHQDDLAKRATLHRWNLSDYCNADGTPLASSVKTEQDAVQNTKDEQDAAESPEDDQDLYEGL